MCNKHFYIERKVPGELAVEAVPLFETNRKLELIYIGTEIVYKGNKYRVTRIESFFEYEVFCNGETQDHIDIFVEDDCGNGELEVTNTNEVED